MIVGVPKEIKNNEFRVGLTPGGVREFVAHDHGVLVEQGAGDGSSFTDAEYASAGAEMEHVILRWGCTSVQPVSTPNATSWRRF